MSELYRKHLIRRLNGDSNRANNANVFSFDVISPITVNSDTNRFSDNNFDVILPYQSQNFEWRQSTPVRESLQFGNTIKIHNPETEFDAKSVMLKNVEKMGSLEINESNKSVRKKGSNDYSGSLEAERMDLTNCHDSNNIFKISNSNDNLMSETENMELTCYDNNRFQIITKQTRQSNLKSESMELTACCDNNYYIGNSKSTDNKSMKKSKLDSMDLTACCDNNYYIGNSKSTDKKSVKKSKLDRMDLTNFSDTRNSKSKDEKRRVNDVLSSCNKLTHMMKPIIGSYGKIQILKKIYTTGNFQELRKQCSPRNSYEISRFLTDLTESRNLSHLSNDSVFERMHEFSVPNDSGKVAYKTKFFELLHNKNFIDVLKNLMSKIFYYFQVALSRIYRKTVHFFQVKFYKI